MRRFISQPTRHLLDGTARSVLAGLLLPLTGLVTAAFLTRTLGTEGYGMLALATTLFGWFELSINSLFSRATIKLIGEADDWRPAGMTAIRLHVLTGAGGGLLLVLLSFPLVWLLREPAIMPYLALYALHLPVSALSQAHQNILIGIGDFRRKALCNAARWLARLVLILLLVSLGLSIGGAILGSLGASLIELAVSRRSIRPPMFGGVMTAVRPFYDLGLVLGTSSLFLLVFSSLTLIMLKALGGTLQEVGIYGAAQNLAMLPALFGSACSPLLLSTVNRLLTEGRIDEAKRIGRGAMRLVTAMLPFGALIGGAAPEIVTWVFGRSFETAAPILAILIIGAIAFLLVSVAAVIATASGFPRITLYLSGLLLLASAAANLALISWLGAYGGALATAVCQLLGAIASIVIVDRLWLIVPPLETFRRSLAASAVTYALAVLWPTAGILLVVKLAVLGAMIGLVYLALGEWSAGELLGLAPSRMETSNRGCGGPNRVAGGARLDGV